MRPLRTSPMPGRVLLAMAGVLVLGAASCSSGSSSAPTSAAVSTSIVASTEASEPTTSAPPATTGAAAEATTTVGPSPTGVPGIAVENGFCADWARYSGTLQIISVAINFAELSSIQSATLELESAATVSDAVHDIDAAWPAAIAAEHRTAVDDYLGPFERRAEQALAALRGAGVTDAELGELRTAWAHVLATRDPDRPDVTVDLPPELAAKVDAAATAFDAALTPFGSDPSLAVDFDSIPATKAFLAATCPDLASIGVGDDV